MSLRQFAILAILTLTPSLLDATPIDCSVEDTCFGEPYDCDPNTGCRTLFHFDVAGNLHLFVRNLTEMHGYAAFAVQPHPDEIIEYFICVPRQGLRVRALAELGGVVLVTEQNLTGSINRLGDDYFRCIFSVSELPKQFRNEQIFFVTRGIYDEVMVIYDGDQLFNLNLFEDDDDEDYEQEEVHPVIHQIGSPVRHRSMDDVLTAEDRDTISDALRNLPSSSKSKDDIALEKIARSPRHLRSRNDRDEDDEEMEEERPRKNHGQKSKARSSRYEEDDEETEEEERRPRTRSNKRNRHHDDEEILDDEDYEISKKKNNKRRNEDKDDEPKRRKNSKKDSDEEEYENQDESYDDLDNSVNTKKWTFVFMFGLIRLFF